MPLSQIAHVFMLLAAACGGAIALIVLGLGLRLRTADAVAIPERSLGLGLVAAPPAARLATSLDALRPTMAVAWALVPVALVAALVPAEPLRHSLLLGGVAAAGLLGLHACLRSGPDRAQAWSFAAAQTAAIALAVLWGDRLAPVEGVGRAFPCAFAAVMVLVATPLGLAPDRWRPVVPLGVAALGALAAFGLSTRVLGAADLWQPAAAGCAIAGAVALVLALAGQGADGDLAPPLGFALVLLAGGAALLLVGRQFGMAGVATAAIGMLPLAACRSGPAVRLGTLLAALFAGRALLGWLVLESGLTNRSVDITQPFAFAALAAGLALAAAPIAVGPNASGALAANAVTAAAALLPPAVAVVVGAEALPALLAGLVAGTLVVGAVQPGPPTAPVAPLIAYVGALAALIGPRLANLGPPLATWRIGGLLALVALVTLAAVVSIISSAKHQGSDD